MKFSLILPSRQRVHLLKNLLNSVRQNTKRISEIEVLVGIDLDDKETIKFASSEYGYPFAQFLARERSVYLNHDYLNWLYSFSHGKYIICLNDDTEFTTPNWDVIAWENLEKYLADKPDGIVYAGPEDLLPPDSKIGRVGYSCFPIISRAGVEAVGWCMPGDFCSWGADIVVFRAYAAVERNIELRQITVKHNSFHTGLRERDEISHYVQTIVRLGRMDPVEYDISEAAARLMEKINGHLGI